MEPGVAFAGYPAQHLLLSRRGDPIKRPVCPSRKKMTDTIKKSGKSKSKWIADLIREKTAGSWPENIINLAGAWSDLPTAEEIRKTMGRDMKRESI